jgi:hypothetical protein
VNTFDPHNLATEGIPLWPTNAYSEVYLGAWPLTAPVPPIPPEPPEPPLGRFAGGWTREKPPQTKRKVPEAYDDAEELVILF